MWTQARDALQSQGFNGGELGWILEDNLAMRRLIEFGGARLRKIFASTRRIWVTPPNIMTRTNIMTETGR
jgi:hypothetical protein